LRAQLFVHGKLVRLFTVFVSGIEARQPRAAVDQRCSSDMRPSQLKEHSTLKSLCRETKNRSDLARHAPSSLAATWYRLFEATQRTLPRAAAARNIYSALEKSTASILGRVPYSSILSWWFLQYNGAYLQGRKGSYSFTLNVDAAHSSETLVPVYRNKKKTVICIPMIIIFIGISNV
jgi:hypothetical protein